MKENKKQREKPLTQAGKAINMKREKLKQAKLDFLITRPLSKSEQKKIDGSIVNYIISELDPFKLLWNRLFGNGLRLKPTSKDNGCKKIGQVNQDGTGKLVH